MLAEGAVRFKVVVFPKVIAVGVLQAAELRKFTVPPLRVMVEFTFAPPPKFKVPDPVLVKVPVAPRFRLPVTVAFPEPLKVAFEFVDAVTLGRVRRVETPGDV